MDDKTKARYEAKSVELRADLKKWESDWADTHDGSKPGREDIKNNPDIGTCRLTGQMQKVRADMSSSQIQGLQQGPRCAVW